MPKLFEVWYVAINSLSVTRKYIEQYDKVTQKTIHRRAPMRLQIIFASMKLMSEDCASAETCVGNAAGDSKWRVHTCKDIHHTV